LPDADDLVQGRTRACLDARTCVAAYTCARARARACARGKDVSCSDLNTIPAGRFLREINLLSAVSVSSRWSHGTHRLRTAFAAALIHPDTRTDTRAYTCARTRTCRHVHTCKPSADAATRHASRSRAMLARLARRHVCLATSGISVTVNYARMIRGGECSKGVGRERARGGW